MRGSIERHESAWLLAANPRQWLSNSTVSAHMRPQEKFTRRRWWRAGACRSLYYQHRRGDIVCADALEFLHELRPRSADVVFLDPPFNLGKEYAANSKHTDSVRETDYLHYMQQVLVRSCDILTDGGALYFYHIPRLALALSPILSSRLRFRHWIAIAMKNGFVYPGALYPAHYALLYFTKGDPRHFQRPKLKPPECRNCHAPIKDYGGYKRFVVDGVNLSDYWDDISPVRHRKYKHRRANELPPIIVERVVTISGAPGALLIDPFAGTGACVAAAVAHRMRFVACDREIEACRIMKERLQSRRPEDGQH
jgi:site-specific DNA-methyltransferase (adenine-specific)